MKTLDTTNARIKLQSIRQVPQGAYLDNPKPRTYWRSVVDGEVGFWYSTKKAALRAAEYAL